MSKKNNKRAAPAKTAKAAPKPVKKMAKTKAVALKNVKVAKAQGKQKGAQPKEKVAEPRKKANLSISPPDVVKKEIEGLLSNEKVNEYLKRNVSKTAIDILYMLNTPKTDEHLAEQLGLKINAIRRILNIMQGYGITNYYVSKNTKGWLSFAWYINTTKLAPFLEFVNKTEGENAVVSNNCNDYFMCNDCYKSDNLVYTFDAAFESGFKCTCGKSLSQMDKAEAETVLNKS